LSSTEPMRLVMSAIFAPFASRSLSACTTMSGPRALTANWRRIPSSSRLAAHRDDVVTARRELLSQRETDAAVGAGDEDGVGHGDEGSPCPCGRDVCFCGCLAATSPAALRRHALEVPRAYRDPGKPQG